VAPAARSYTATGKNLRPLPVHTRDQRRPVSRLVPRARGTRRPHATRTRHRTRTRAFSPSCPRRPSLPSNPRNPLPVHTHDRRATCPRWCPVLVAPAARTLPAPATVPAPVRFRPRITHRPSLPKHPYPRLCPSPSRGLVSIDGRVGPGVARLEVSRHGSCFVVCNLGRSVAQRSSGTRGYMGFRSECACPRNPVVSTTSGPFSVVRKAAGQTISRLHYGGFMPRAWRVSVGRMKKMKLVRHITRGFGTFLIPPIDPS
jgi:hypothetical protein